MSVIGAWMTRGGECRSVCREVVWSKCSSWFFWQLNLETQFFVSEKLFDSPKQVKLAKLAFTSCMQHMSSSF